MKEPLFFCPFIPAKHIETNAYARLFSYFKISSFLKLGVMYHLQSISEGELQCMIRLFSITVLYPMDSESGNFWFTVVSPHNVIRLLS